MCSACAWVCVKHEFLKTNHTCKTRIPCKAQWKPGFAHQVVDTSKEDTLLACCCGSLWLCMCVCLCWVCGSCWHQQCSNLNCMNHNGSNIIHKIWIMESVSLHKHFRRGVNFSTKQLWLQWFGVWGHPDRNLQSYNIIVLRVNNCSLSRDGFIYIDNKTWRAQ